MRRALFPLFPLVKSIAYLEERSCLRRRRWGDPAKDITPLLVFVFRIQGYQWYDRGWACGCRAKDSFLYECCLSRLLLTLLSFLSWVCETILTYFPFFLQMMVMMMTLHDSLGNLQAIFFSSVKPFSFPFSFRSSGMTFSCRPWMKVQFRFCLHFPFFAILSFPLRVRKQNIFTFRLKSEYKDRKRISMFLIITFNGYC